MPVGALPSEHSRPGLADNPIGYCDCIQSPTKGHLSVRFDCDNDCLNNTDQDQKADEDTPDVVSMDHVFIEADDQGHPIENTIWLETWDMPLPKPVLVAKLEGNKIIATLVKQGWVFPGKTTVELSDKSVEISNLNVVDERRLEIAVNRAPTTGTSISFETHSEFYYHSGHAEISHRSN